MFLFGKYEDHKTLLMKKIEIEIVLLKHIETTKGCPKSMLGEVAGQVVVLLFFGNFDLETYYLVIVKYKIKNF